MRTLTRDELQTLFRSIPADDNGCQSWTRALNSEGYGRIGHAGRTWGAHRLAYITLVGPVPEGLHIDHLCRNRACVNPAHLEPVTPATNVRRGARSLSGTYGPRKPPRPRREGLEYLGVTAAAEMAGCSVATIKRAALAGTLPHHIKLDGATGAYLFRAADVERWALRRNAA